MSDTTEAKSGAPASIGYSSPYRAYVLFILTLVYTFNFIDRQILVILQDSIKLDMGLSDSQLGLLGGTTFAIFYVTAGIPIARWADRSNRKNIVSVSLTIWSAMTAVSGLAMNFWQLALARIGVGIGEAGGSPPAHSMISDYFPPEKRSFALGIYSTGVYIGITLGYLFGGVLGSMYGWRNVFFLLGMPGILLAIIMYFTVKEPPRGLGDGTADHDHNNGPSFFEAMKYMWSFKSFRYLSLAAAFASFVGYGTGNFMPSFLARIHEMSITDRSIALGLVGGLGGAAGMLLGGYLTQRLGRKDIRWFMWVPAIGAPIALILVLPVFFIDDIPTMLGMYITPVILSALYLPPCIAMAHALVPANMRALASAILFFILNLIGLGLGPLFVGAISDALYPYMGHDGLRYALVIGSLVGLVSMVMFLLAAKHLPADMKRVSSTKI